MSKLIKPAVLLIVVSLLFHYALKNRLPFKIDYLDLAIYMIGLPLCILSLRMNHYKNEMSFNQVFIDSFSLSIIVIFTCLAFDLLVGNPLNEMINDTKIQNVVYTAEQNRSFSGQQKSDLINFLLSTEKGIAILSAIGGIANGLGYSLLLALLLRKEK